MLCLLDARHKILSELNGGIAQKFVIVYSLFCVCQTATQELEKILEAWINGNKHQT